jgi:peptide/nickel transport system substrate-binding protein
MSSYWDRLLDRRISRRRALAATGGTALGSALLVACGGGGDSGGLKFDDAATSREPGTVWFAANDWKLADETKEAVKGGIYRGHMTADQAGHYDAMSIAPSQCPSADHVIEFLMGKNRGPGIDPRSSEAASPVPTLAENFEISSDGLTVTFTMRPNVKWHPVAPVNGRVMDIDDWRTSLERFLASSPQAVPLNDVLERAAYPDASHMTWRLKYPYAPLIARIWSERFSPPIMPKELNANPTLAEQVAIGSGFKVLDKHNRAVAMEYRKHVDYWGGEPFIDRWHAPIIPEYSNRYAQFVSGNIMDFTPTARDVLLLAKDAPQTVIVADDLADDSFAQLRFGRQNQKTLPWKDPRVRVALLRSMNFKGIGEFISNKAQFEAAGIQIELAPRTHLPRNLSYWLDPEKGELGALSENYLFNPAAAKQLMVAAGHNQAVPIDYYVLPSGGEIPEQDQLVIDSLNQSGNFAVNVIRSINSVEHRNCRSLGRCDGIVQTSVSEEADYVIYRDFHSQGNTEGEQAYPDPRIDRVAEAQRKELDVAKRIEHLKEFQMIAAELIPVLPWIHQYTSFRFRWPWLHNSNYGDAGSPPEGRPIPGGHLQWLDAEMPRRNTGAS